MKFIPLIALMFLSVACAPTNDTSKFDKWYEQVINEPYDPMNGSKY